ncbi:hypothetical protein B0J12DRAFT_699896 [Macrophomina phaseolina]|uniref:Uncharacterized protein n=1 Tax=Macrophomina phaseolina TaxID=35725 RepID=A0ABQ8G9L3_9PEZI|nr:hypothetical protein B0J12DRAFT_699896 [Macrophomina phaseolina]
MRNGSRCQKQQQQQPQRRSAGWQAEAGRQRSAGRAPTEGSVAHAASTTPTAAVTVAVARPPRAPRGRPGPGWQGWRRSPPSSRSRRGALTGRLCRWRSAARVPFVRWSQWISPASAASPVRSADRRTMISFRHSAANFLQPAQGPETPPSFKEPPPRVRLPAAPAAAAAAAAPAALPGPPPRLARRGIRQVTRAFTTRPARRGDHARTAARGAQARSRPPRHAAASLALTGLSRHSRRPPCRRSAHQPCARRVSPTRS